MYRNGRGKTPARHQPFEGWFSPAILDFTQVRARQNSALESEGIGPVDGVVALVIRYGGVGWYLNW